jgi:hypothetical protein
MGATVCVVAAITGASAASADPGARAERVYALSDCQHQRFEPRRIIMTCADGGFVVQQLRWKRWNRYAARGTGVALINDCNPYCAAGHYHRYAISLKLKRVRRCPNGRLQFQEADYGFPAGRPRGWAGSTQPFSCTQ